MVLHKVYLKSSESFHNYVGQGSVTTYKEIWIEAADVRGLVSDSKFIITDETKVVNRLVERTVIEVESK